MAQKALAFADAHHSMVFSTMKFAPALQPNPISGRQTHMLRYLFAALVGVTAISAQGHVMQQLSWFQVERHASFRPGVLRVHHECRFDHQVFKGDDPIIDADGDTTASRHEIAQFCQSASNYVAQDFVVLADGLPCGVRQESFAVNDDDSGFSSDIVVDLPDMYTTGSRTLHIVDPSFMFSFPGDSGTTSTRVEAEPPLALVNDKSERVERIDVARSPHVMVRVIRQGGAPVMAETATTGTKQ